MTNSEILIVLKTDLQISVNHYDNYLEKLIHAATAAIKNEGINLKEDIADGMLVEQYAAHLFRKRKENEFSMPRSLRWQLNNRLFKEKAGAV